MIKDYTIATVSTGTPHEWYNLQKEFYKSLDVEDVVTINYQNDMPWNGFSMKPKWLYRAIKEGIIKTPYLIFCDSWDLVWATSPQEAIDKYKTMDCDIVVNAETNMFPPDYAEGFSKLEAPTKWRYLNSGFIIGKTESILACLESMDLPNVLGDHWDEKRNCMEHPDDQRMWQKIFLNQPEGITIKLDYYCELSQTLHDANINDFDFSEKRVSNLVTNSYPCAFHLNGNSKSNTDIRKPILSHLNLL